MFASTQMGGMDICIIPDICKTPPTAVPLPYPNIAEGAIGTPPVPNVLFSGAPAHNLLTTVPVSFGDEPGVMGGILSGIIKGPAHPITGAFTVLVGGLPCHRIGEGEEIRLL